MKSNFNILHIVLSLRIGGLERVVLDLIKFSPLENNLSVCCLDEIGDYKDKEIAPSDFETT